MITRTVLLPCNAERAFVLFTERAGEWWPAERRHTRDSQSTIRIEKTGRFYERSTDGAEVELGIVRVFNPGEKLVLDWYPGTGAAAPTHVVVRFELEGSATRVVVDSAEFAVILARICGPPDTFSRRKIPSLKCHGNTRK